MADILLQECSFVSLRASFYVSILETLSPLLRYAYSPYHLREEERETIR